jgi:flagellar hook protein FlgE
MLSSMYSGISGLKSNSDSLNVVGNNISNVNTTGYKSSRASFEDVLYQTVAGTSGSSQVGRGSALAAVETDFSQGSFETTNSTTDLAIGGAGFFIVKKEGDDSSYYTRAGGFSLDKDGNLVDSAGDFLQGKAIDRTTNTAYGVDANIAISQQPSEPRATQEIDMVVNLQSDAAWKGSISTPVSTTAGKDVIGVAASASGYPTTGDYSTAFAVNGTDYTVTMALPDGSFVAGNVTAAEATGTVTDFTGILVDGTGAPILDADGNQQTIKTGLDLTFGGIVAGETSSWTIGGFDPTSTSTISNTSNYASSIMVYDSLGTGHVVTVNFRKDSEAATSSTWEWNVTTEGSDTIGSGGSGTLTFNNNGVLVVGGTAQDVTFDFAGAAAGQTIHLLFGPSSGEGATTQYPISSKTNYQSQDGFAPGTLQSISVSDDGIISGTYDNGQILKLYQITLANFNNPQGLKREGGNLYSATLESGNAYTSTPGDGGTGKISANSLEQSNVDLATEFVRMIIAQRGYEANSKVITTTDEVLQTLMNLKR